MHQNPYEPPQTKGVRRGIRFTTILVLAGLILLAAACIALGFVAYLIQGLA